VKRYNPYGKRLFDLLLLILIGPIIILLSPLLLLLALAIRLDSPGPIFFAQTRAGLHGHPFLIYKFRTLVLNEVDKLSMGHVTHDHPMSTRTGRLMRRFKIDELPQLWNIFKGDMSFVGPRPVYLEMVADYTPDQIRRLHAPPGLAGWSQVNGNCELPWDERIRLDLWYVDHRSFWLDLRILLMTIGVVLGGERVNTQALAQADAYFDSLPQKASSESAYETRKVNNQSVTQY